MPADARVDVALNIFAKPYQTALSVLSLLRFSGGHIDRVFLQFEPSGSVYDHALPYAIAEYLGDRAVVSQPGYWLQLDAADRSRFEDPEYRLSVRYQHAFETTDKRYLFVLHNDVLIKRDIIGAMLAGIGDAFVIGHLGQCWNCPAANEELVRLAGCGDKACTPETYLDFRPGPDGLLRLYALAEQNGVFVRPYYQAFDEHYSSRAWPLPECRVNEWGCLVDAAKTREFVVPQGDILPFGAFEQCGAICLDTATAWFRDLHRRGFHARHMSLAPYLQHWVGNGKMTDYTYSKAEGNARLILEKNFALFAHWCRERKNGMFPN